MLQKKIQCRERSLGTRVLILNFDSGALFSSFRTRVNSVVICIAKHIENDCGATQKPWVIDAAHFNFSESCEKRTSFGGGIRMRAKTTVFLALVSFLSACGSPSGGGGSDTSVKSKTQQTSFEFIEMAFGGGNKCTTTMREFDTTEAMCNALKQRSENQNCALEQRKSFFSEVSCTGNFEETSFWMSSERLISEPAGLCKIQYVGPNPILDRLLYCDSLIELYRIYRCGRESLRKDFVEAFCAGEFPAN
jgi:hypothetical protein